MCIKFDPVTGEQAPLFSRDLHAWTFPSIRDIQRGKGIFPGDKSSIYLADGTIDEARWGLQPFWPKLKNGLPDINWGKKNAYNARSETITEKPTFRTPFQKRRCIIPAGSFFERADGRWLQITPTNDTPFILAGLYEEPNSLSDIRTFTFATTEPNLRMADVHDRMPVLLGLESVKAWLDPTTLVEELKRLLVPCPEEWLHVEDDGPVLTGKKKVAETAKAELFGEE